MRCAVTGGAGFIGSHVADELIDMGHDVLIIDDESGGYACNINPSATWLKVALEDLPAGALRGVEVVYHLAAFGALGFCFFAPSLSARRNFVAFSRLISECIEEHVRTVVFASSMAVYGKAGAVPFDESASLRPREPYGVAKAACEQLLVCYSRHFGFDHVIVRPHNVYGVRQNLADPYRNVVGILVRQMLEGRPLTIFGDGSQRRAFSHVRDVAPCIAKAGLCRDAVGRAINVGSGRVWSVLEVAEVLQEIAGSELEVRYLPARPADLDEAYCTTALGERILGLREQTDLRTGLLEMVEWAGSLDLAPFKWLHDQVEISSGLPKSWSSAQREVSQLSQPLLQSDHARNG